jgi:RNA polymerase sigma-70 factor, ECF subfamily
MEGPVDLAEMFDRSVDAGLRAWPTFEIDRKSFRRCLESAIANITDPREALSNLYIEDLCLAHACALRVPAALRIFEALHLAHIEDSLNYLRRLPFSLDDVRRQLEDILIVGTNGHGPRIAQYAGRGPLSRYVRTAAVNVARDMLRRRSFDVAADGDALAESALASSEDAATQLVQARYEPAIREAVQAALLALDRRQRLIVRLHLSKGTSFSAIARMLHVNQSTITRAFATTLRQLHADVSRRLRTTYGFDGSDVESIVRDLRGHIDLSLSRLLSASDL